MQKEIEQKLRHWFREMLTKYSWLSFKLEFDKKRQVYLVSFYNRKVKKTILIFSQMVVHPLPEIDENEEFCHDAMVFEDKMNYLYGQEAPLFCNEETLFSLSENAEIIDSGSIQ